MILAQIAELYATPQYRKLILAAAALFAILLLRWLAARVIARSTQVGESLYRLRKVGNLFFLATAALVLVLIYSEQLRGFSVALGVAGAGIAFALQEVIASFAGWVAIMFGGFFRPGDRVQLGGIKGDVIDIGMLRTTLMECGEWVKADQYSGRIVRVANSFVFKAPVFNYSGDFPFVWDEITLPVKYGSDRAMARDILERAAAATVGGYSEHAQRSWDSLTRKFLLEDARIAPAVTLVANDNWLEYTLRFVVDYKKRRTTKDALFSLILDEFDKTDGRVAIASMTVQLVEAPRFTVKMER